MNYKICFCFKKKRENLKYNIKINDKYYEKILRYKKYVEDLKNIIKFRTFFRNKRI